MLPQAKHPGGRRYHAEPIEMPTIYREHTRHPFPALTGLEWIVAPRNLSRVPTRAAGGCPKWGQKRHKLLRLLAAKSTTEQMGKIVPNPALRNFGAAHSTHVGGCRQFSRCVAGKFRVEL